VTADTRAGGRVTPPRAAPVVLGVEAGATRTVAIADGGDLAGPVRREFGPANLYLLDDDQLARRLRAVARAMPHPDSVAIGMAGARTNADRGRVRRAAGAAWPGVPCCATSDLETCLAAADAGGARTRVLIISGTGSCCFARAADSRTARLGGWGHVLGDRGSGYDIVVRTLRAVVHAADRRGGWPALGRRFLRVLGLGEPHALVEWIQRAGKPEVAALAVEVFRAAEGGDRLARAVLAEAAHGLAADGAACAQLLVNPGTPVQFVLAGGVLLRQPGFAGRVRRALRRLWPGAVVTSLRVESAWGAVELARQRAGRRKWDRDEFRRRQRREIRPGPISPYASRNPSGRLSP
jgi:N-acetylglucosamine kinase-like BadF-type ATPase